MDIEVNNRNIFSAVPVCNDVYRQPIPSGVLNVGKNFIVFKSSKGYYSIEQIEMEFDFKEIKVAYYFEIDENNWEKIKDEGMGIWLRIEFPKGNEQSQINLNINGHSALTEQVGLISTYENNLKVWIEKGNNYIILEPEKKVSINEVKVELDDGAILLLEYPGELS